MSTKTDKENIGPAVAVKLQKLLRAALEKGDILNTEEIQLVIGSTSRPTVAKYRRFLKDRYDDLFAGVISPEDGAARPLVKSKPQEETNDQDPSEVYEEMSNLGKDSHEAYSKTKETPSEVFLIDENGFETPLELIYDNQHGRFYKLPVPDKVVEVTVKGQKYSVNYTALLEKDDSEPTEVPDVNAGKLKILIELR